MTTSRNETLAARVALLVDRRLEDLDDLLNFGMDFDDAVASIRSSSVLGPEPWKTFLVRAERRRRVLEVRRAIEEGRAWLDTAFGRRKVVGYRDETGDCVTNNGGPNDQRTFVVCLDAIKIDDAPGKGVAS